MLRKAARFLFLLVMALFLVACSVSESPAAEETPSIIGEEIEIRVGETFTISRRGEPVAGYLWAIETPPSAIVEQVGEMLVELDSDDENAEASFVYTYRAVSAGSTYIKLIYHQPFESTPPTAIYEATILVSP